MIDLKNISTKDILLELFKRPEISSARAFGSREFDINKAYDSYEISTTFHLSNEEWSEHFAD